MPISPPNYTARRSRRGSTLIADFKSYIMRISWALGVDTLMTADGDAFGDGAVMLILRRRRR